MVLAAVVFGTALVVCTLIVTRTIVDITQLLANTAQRIITQILDATYEK